MEEKCMHVLACFSLQNLLTQCTGDCRKVRFLCAFSFGFLVMGYLCQGRERDLRIFVVQIKGEQS